MSTVQQILDDVNLRYRNSFTISQIIVWMNEEQRELFEILELDAVPFSFSTVASQYLYPIPDGVEIDKIKVMTYQINDNTNPDFIELPFKENDNRQFVSSSDYWYTIVEDNFYLNIPTVPINNRLIYIYVDQQPEDISALILSVEPTVPVRYQEILKLGTLKRIAMARKDSSMYNNYTSDYEQKIADWQEKMRLQVPEYHKPIDMFPRFNRYRTGRYDYRYFNS